MKRAAAAEAQNNISAGVSSQSHDFPPTLMSPPFENPGSASPLVTFFLHELGPLIAPIPPSSTYQVVGAYPISTAD